MGFMSSQPNLSKILSSRQIKAWRTQPDAGTRVAVVADSFGLLHPGNLYRLQEAKKRFPRVCAVLTAMPAELSFPDGKDRPDIRAEFVAGLKEADGVVHRDDPKKLEAALRALKPYTWIRLRGEAGEGPDLEAIGRWADDVLELPAFAGGSWRELVRLIREGRTPLAAPAMVTDPQPGFEELHAIVSVRKTVGGRLVTVNGCFDLLHIGHLRLLAQARALGNYLVALVNDDESVRAYKGARRPVFPLAFRLRALAELESVSLAYPFSGDNPLSLLAKLQPDIHVKGGSFEEERVAQERQLLKSWNGELRLLPLVEGFSTTRLLDGLGTGK